MGEFAHIGRKHRYKPLCTGATSTLYGHYKHLVLILQASCTDATKYLVLMLDMCMLKLVYHTIHCKTNFFEPALNQSQPSFHYLYRPHISLPLVCIHPAFFIQKSMVWWK